MPVAGELTVGTVGAMLAELSALAARQDGLLTRLQVLSAGVPSSTIGTWVARKQLIVVHRGVYAMPATELTIRATARAAVLAVGDVPAVASYQLARTCMASAYELLVRRRTSPFQLRFIDPVVARW